MGGCVANCGTIETAEGGEVEKIMGGRWEIDRLLLFYYNSDLRSFSILVLAC